MSKTYACPRRSSPRPRGRSKTGDTSIPMIHVHHGVDADVCSFSSFLISSALRSSGSVGACVRRHFEAVRGAQLRGSISYHTPVLRESVGGDAEVLEVAP